MKKVILTLVAALGVGTAATAAPTAVEDFLGLNPASLGTSTSSLGAGTWTEPFAGPPNATIATTGAYSGAPDNTYVTLDGEDLQLLSFTASANITGTAGPTLNTAFLLRINTVAPANAQNTIDIVTVTTNNDAGRIFSIGLFEGDLGLSYNRYFQGTQGGLVLDNAADATTPVLTPGNWYVVAGRLTPDATGTGTSSWWIYPAGSSVPVANGVVVDQGAGAGTAVTGVNNIQYGQKINDPFTDDYTGINVSVDQVAFFDSALDQATFLSEVQSYFQLTTVSDWTMF